MTGAYSQDYLIATLTRDTRALRILLEDSNAAAVLLLENIEAGIGQLTESGEPPGARPKPQIFMLGTVVDPNGSWEDV